MMDVSLGGSSSLESNLRPILFLSVDVPYLPEYRMY